MSSYWSFLLTAVGVFGLYLAGKKDRRGWMVGIGAQVLWIAYATATHQWGFYLSALAYGWVYIKNARSWKPSSAVVQCDQCLHDHVLPDQIKWVNPVGWDHHHQRVHDVTVMPGGPILHHSICWCRTEIGWDE